MAKTSEDKLQKLKERLATISDLDAVSLNLAWDQQTYMPEGGVRGRSEQLATLARLSHEMFVSEDTGELLESLENLSPDTDDGAIVRVARRDYEKSAKLPARLVEEISRSRSLAEPAWAKAREASDWGAFAPHLENLLSLQREAAEHLGYTDHPYEAMLDNFEPGAQKAFLEKMFEELKSGIVPLLRRIPNALEEDLTPPLHGTFDVKLQEEFGTSVATAFGYDWSRGRQDRAIHPFCVGINTGDVRITTRFDPGWLSPALFATFHEAGPRNVRTRHKSRLLPYPSWRRRLDGSSRIPVPNLGEPGRPVAPLLGTLLPGVEKRLFPKPWAKRTWRLSTAL